MSDQVLFEVADGVGRILLNRPRAINALTLDMMSAIGDRLRAWALDDAVTAVELRGAGERGLCAGADVRALREVLMGEHPEEAMRFFEVEYAVNRLISEYPKPFTSWMTGITMGGGLGLSEHGTRRIATATTQWAMPETIIGFFPDVGVLYELSHTDGELGTHLALTGLAADGVSALYARLVDEVEGYDGDASESELAQAAPWIAECYAGDDAAVILERLRNHPSADAQAAGEALASRCPWSVCVTLAALRRAASMTTVAEVLEQDLVLAGAFVRNSEIVEGVRAQVVDKDRDPHWRHASVADVPRDEVEALFGRPDHL